MLILSTGGNRFCSGPVMCISVVQNTEWTTDLNQSFANASSMLGAMGRKVSNPAISKTSFT